MANKTKHSRKKSHKHSRSPKVTSSISQSKDNGMMTKVWGPAGWVFLHSCVTGYPTVIDKKDKQHRKRKKETKRFFESIGYVLPCRYCRESYNRFIKELPISRHLDSRQSLSRWLYRIHNKVNRKLGIPRCDIPTFGEVTKRYETYRAKCHRTTKEEREERLEKGCVVPKDGVRKRCIIKIISTR
jgi:hypothetical protein